MHEEPCSPAKLSDPARELLQISEADARRYGRFQSGTESKPSGPQKSSLNVIQRTSHGCVAPNPMNDKAER